MNSHTVDWTALRGPASGGREIVGLREKRKHATRQTLIDTATGMFIDRGFDAVTIAEIADACGVAPATVFNYFPTKESLILDLPDALVATLRTALADPLTTPLEAMLGILAGELEHLVSWLDAQEDKARAADAVQRFEALVRETPSLKSHHRAMLDHMSDVARQVLAQRAGLDPQDPEPQIAGVALLGLWSVQVNSSCKHLDGVRTPSQVRKAVTADVRRAASLLEGGLAGFADSPRPRRTGSARAERSTPNR